VSAKPSKGAAFRRPSRDEDAGSDAALARASGDVATKRSCIACGRSFESEGWHNRMCQPCRRLSDPVR